MNSKIERNKDVPDLQLAKITDLNYDKFKEFANSKIKVIKNTRNNILINNYRSGRTESKQSGAYMSVDFSKFVLLQLINYDLENPGMVDKQLDLHFKQSLNTGFNPISNTFDRAHIVSKRYQ